MSGAAWLVSYVLLCFTVACVALAVANLYREGPYAPLHQPAEIMASQWPFKTVGPSHDISAYVEQWGTPATGFYLFATAELDCYPAAASAAALAGRWGQPSALVVRESRSGEWWLRQLPEAWSISVADASGEAFEQLGVRGVPVTAFVRDGVLLEAVSGVLSPHHLAEHFRMVAEPLNGAQRFGPNQSLPIGGIA